MKKLLMFTLSLVLMFGMMLFGSSVYAADVSGNIVLSTDKTEYNPGDTVNVTVKFGQFSFASTGVGFAGTIKYDNTKLKLEGVTTSSPWDAVSSDNYNPAKGKFVFYTSSKPEAGATVMTIKFTVLSQDADTSSVTIENVDVLDNALPVTGATVKVVKVQEEEPPVEEPEKGEDKTPDTTETETPKEDEKPGEQEGSKNDENDNGEYPNKLPQTGDNGIIYYGIAIIPSIAILAIAIVIYRRRVNARREE